MEDGLRHDGPWRKGHRETQMISRWSSRTPGRFSSGSLSRDLFGRFRLGLLAKTREDVQHSGMTITGQQKIGSVLVYGV